MEINRITLPPMTGPGEVTTFYSYDNGAARSVALAHTALLLAGRQNATLPVLMIDWDLEAPGLHTLFPMRDERFENERPERADAARLDALRPGTSSQTRPLPAHCGVLEYFETCREQLDILARTCSDADPDERARLVLEAIDWEAYVERVDQGRTLYLMRAGRFDDSYGERVARLDFDALFAACPALFRAFAAHLARHFRHILIDCRSGRSAAVSVCTTLLPDKLVGLFSPAARSLEGLTGVVARAIEYRCSHEEAQHPLLVYPVPCAAEGMDGERRLLWRRGDPQRGVTGYQPALEQLLRTCYGLKGGSLDSYLDEVQLSGSQLAAQSASAGLAGPAPAGAAALLPERDADRLSLARGLEALLGWAAEGRFTWQSRAELAALDAVAAARAMLAPAAEHETATRDPNGVLLAGALLRLGELYRQQGRGLQAQACFQESLAWRQGLLGEAHPDTRASRAALAAALRDAGRLQEARQQYDLLLEHCLQDAGPAHLDTIAARSGLAATLARLDEFTRALALHEEVVDACEDQFGPGHILTLDALAGQARTLAAHGEYSRARMLYERVLEGRQRVLGTEHEDTLRCTEQLATLLRDMGDLGNARKLQENVVRVRERLAGLDAAMTLQAHEALAEIFAAQGDLGAVRQMQQSLATARARRLGSDHPDTLGVLLRLASTLSQQGELEEARRLQQHVVSQHERLRGMDDHETLRSKQMLAQTLSSQGHSAAARRLEETVEEGGSRLRQLRAISAGLQDMSWLLPGLGPAGAGARASNVHVPVRESRSAHANAALSGISPPGSSPSLSPGASGSASSTASSTSSTSSPGMNDQLEQKLGQLHKLVEAGRAREARVLADSLRETILRPAVTRPLRRRGVALIKQVYLDDGDKDALLAFAEDEVAALEGALIEASGGRSLALR